MANLDHVFHSLADGTRRAVIAQLASGPASVSDLAQCHKMALSSFMKHIRVLEDCGMIISEKNGRVRMCKLRPDTLSAAQDWLEINRLKWRSNLDQLDTLAVTVDASKNRE